MTNNKKVFWGICVGCPHYCPFVITHRCYYKDEDDNCNFEWEDGGLENRIKEVMDKYER